MTAGEKERHFKQLLRARFGPDCYGPKTRDVRLLDGHAERVEISVDLSLNQTNGEKTILLEIDSGNVAKTLAGQYALLNGLFEGDRTKAAFFVVHYYVDPKTNKPFNPERTLKNLNAVQRFNPSAQWLPYGALHVQAVSAIAEECISMDEFIEALWAMLIWPSTT